MKFAPLVDSPIYLITCTDGNERSGCLVGFATQCSISPPRFLVCLSIANHTYKIAMSSSSLGVHVLDSKDRDLASQFGEQSGDSVDKFASVPWSEGAAGAPMLTDCEVAFEGRILAKIPLGDHVGFLLAPIDEVDVAESLQREQLTLREVSDLEAGHPAD